MEQKQVFFFQGLISSVNLIEFGYFVSVITPLRFSDSFHCVIYRCLTSFLCWFQRLISKFVDGGNDLHHEYEVVRYNKRSLTNVQLVHVQPCAFLVKLL